MIMWGGLGPGEGANPDPLNTGGRYNPTTDQWNATATGINCPSDRVLHTVVWTGSEMIIWGGTSDSSGGCYEPATNSWKTTSTGNDCPSGRYYHSAVWTGTGMIIWGGHADTQNGAIYYPGDTSGVPSLSFPGIVLSICLVSLGLSLRGKLD